MRYAPRVKEATATTGTGTYDLEGAVTGYQRFVIGITDGEKTWYCCTDNTDWEIGIGTVTDAETNTLSRDTVVYSSNSNLEVDWSAGDKDIFCIFPPALLTGIDGHWPSFLGDPNIIGTSDIDEANLAIGINNTVYGQRTIAIGNGNRISSGTYDGVMIGVGGHLCSGTPAVAICSAILGSEGDSQSAMWTTCTETYGGSGVGTGYFTLHGATTKTGTALFEIMAVARQTAGSSGTVGDSKSWILQCMVTFSAEVLAQVGTTVSTVVAASVGASAWTCEIDVSGNSSGGSILVTGEANKTIQWTIFCRQLENSAGYEAP